MKHFALTYEAKSFAQVFALRFGVFIYAAVQRKRAISRPTENATMASDLLLRARMVLDNSSWNRGLAGAGGQLKSFSSLVRNEFNGLHRLMSSTAGRVASLGGGFTAASELVRSAKMDQSLGRIGIAANLSDKQVGMLRSSIMTLGKQSGESLGSLESASSLLFAQGMGFGQVRNSLTAINKTLPLTTASADSLADALGVTSTAFGFDLSKPKEAQLLLDKMATAGNQASAELHQLAPLVSRVGVNARAGGFGYEQMLGFIEGLSKIEKNPERLGTLADSTLRLFTNAQYLKNAQSATGVKFFADDGSRRDPFKVLDDLKTRMDRMKTDAQRENFLSKAFGEADLDTIKGLRTLLNGDMMTQVKTYTKNIENGAGAIENALPGALRNAVSQSGRLKNTLIEAADKFSQRLNGGITTGIQTLLNSKKDGGMGLSGGQLAGGAAAMTLGAYAGGRLLKGAAGRLLGGSAGLASGIAMGNALEKVGAAAPVFIVGAAPGVFSGSGATLGGVTASGAAGGAAARLTGLRMFGARAALAGGSSVFGAGGLMGAGAGGIATTLGAVGVTGVAGYGLGSVANWGINSNRYTRNAFQFAAEPGMRRISYGMAALGSDSALAAIDADRKNGRSMGLSDFVSGATLAGQLSELLRRIVATQTSESKRGAARIGVDVNVTDKRTFATVQQPPGAGSGVVATVRTRAATGRMMPGVGRPD